MWLSNAIFGFWILSEIMITIFTRTKNPVRGSYDRHTLALIWIVIILSVTGGVVIASMFPSFNIYRSFTGMSLIVAGMIIRFVAIFSLKSMFTPNVIIQTEHVLKTDGIFKKIRHPSYSGSLLSFLGLGLALGNWISLVVIFVPIAVIFLYRIRVEEKALISAFGEDYLEYRKVTKRLIPFIY
jgi:protein-S-isoprenylcysteine O-methyltransferase Ste14